MTGHRSFNDLRKSMAPERRARNDETTKAILEEMALHEPRENGGEKVDHGSGGIVLLRAA